MREKRYLCDSCKRNTEAHGSYCAHCERDNRAIRRICERLVANDPSLAFLPYSRIVLHIAKAYLAAKK